MPVETSSSNVLRLPKRGSLARRDEREFLPAALEIVETPASPLGRAIAATLILFFCAALAWATFGKVDIVATARGKVVPVGRVKLIQPLETGTVTAIRVRDGDHVRAGQILVELDPTVNVAERNRVRYDLMRSRLDIARLIALRAELDAGIGFVDFDPPPDAPAYEVERTRATMLAQARQQAAKIAALDRQIDQKKAEADEIAATIDKLKAGLPFLEQTAEVREKAMRLEYGNRIAYLDSQFKLSDQRHELVVQERRAVQSAEARRALESQREQTRAEYAHGIMTDLSDAELKAAQFREDLAKAEKHVRDQTLRAPIDGAVQQLVLHTIGGVVTPAQTLMVIVPGKGRIEIEAMVSNKDIGFVHDGENAEIKVDTFNFTKYGLLHGKVIGVSRDSIIRDKSSAQTVGGSRAGQVASSSEPAGQELLYAARVSLDRTRMQVNDKMVDLKPGMAVTVEIKTGQRRVIEYLLSPLLRYKQESLHER
jgi:hemolysin D